MIVDAALPSWPQSPSIVLLLACLLALSTHSHYGHALAAQARRPNKKGFGSITKKGFGVSSRPKQQELQYSPQTDQLYCRNITIDVISSGSQEDFLALADLRYQEWMMDDPIDKRPSLHAFRMATAEIQQERINEHAFPFLARYSSGAAGKSKEVLAAAELSPIEFRGCFDQRKTDESGVATTKGHDHVHNSYQYFYVTDVVTAKAHRRKGIAAQLMQTLEKYALSRMTDLSPSTNTPCTVVLLMHVEPDNEGALQFYSRLNYEIFHEPGNVDLLQGLDQDRLAENAGVSGQLLLGKLLC